MHAGGVSGGGGGYGKKDRDPLEVRKILDNKKIPWFVKDFRVFLGF